MTYVVLRVITIGTAGYFMIAMIRGIVDSVQQQSIILDVGGIGYEVFASVHVLAQTMVMQELKLYTYHHIREDDERLFGFTTRDEYELFVKFLSVDGVGPKVALAIFSTYPYGQICDALARGDERFFAAVSGLGKKTAAKIVIELKGKVVSLASSASTVAGTGVDNDVVDALVALGFAERDIFGVMQEVDKTLSVDLQVKDALKRITKSQ